MTLDRISFGGGGFTGSISHIQLYVGTPTDFDAAKFAAQRAMGHDGLAGQYTGQRIVTLLQYAGVPTSELSRIDPGVSRMSRASLAGANPLAKLQEAVDTEQGRLRVDGTGIPIFEQRTRRYAQ